MSTQTRYSRTAILLHWLIAGALAFQIGLGLRAEQLDQGGGLYDVLQLHKSIGITILLLTLLRVAIRFFKPPPPALTDEKWAMFLSKLTHGLLYAFMIGAPLTGWLLASTSKLEIDTVVFGAIPWPHFPGMETLAAEPKAAVHEVSETAHEYLSWLGVSLIVLHIAGALRHQFLKSEPLLARMLPLAAARKKMTGSILIVGIAAALGLTMLFVRDYSLNAERPNRSSVSSVAVDQPALPREKQPIKTDSEQPSATQEALKEAPLEELEKNKEPEEIEPAVVTPPVVHDWKVIRKDPIRFSVNRSGSAVRGSFSSWDADIKFSPEALERSAIRVSVNLASAQTGDGSIDQALQGEDFFSTSSFSTAIIKLDQFRALGGNRYEGTGTLAMKGISRPTKLAFTLDINGSNAKVAGTTTTSRSAHNVGMGDYADIADNVSVRFSLSARR